MSSPPPLVPLPRPSVVEPVVAGEEPAVGLNLDTTPAEEQLEAPMQVVAGDRINTALLDAQVGVQVDTAPGSRFPADTTDQLMKLADLWDRGALSNDEFAARRAKLLA